MKYFSICIPTYEMGGYGHVFFQELLAELQQQTFQDFELVISDQSNDDSILRVCEKYSGVLDISYFKNFYNRGKAACNINKAMQYASGKVIKILYQDDFFVVPNALEKIYEEFEKGCSWLVNGFTHTTDKKTFYNTKIPYYHDMVLLGENSLGNPSNISIINKDKIYMDESILYVVDCEYYFRLKQKIGLPKIVEDILVCSRIHPVSAVNNPKFFNLKDTEVEYCLKKNNVKIVG